MMKERKFQCKFCDQRFVHEDRYLRHRCKQMERDEEFRTPIGQAAFLTFEKWMKAMRRGPPKAHTFLHSRYYTTFVRFAKFIKQVNLPDVDSFIWLMVNDNIDPIMWTNDEAYSRYLVYIDRKGKPLTQAKITIDTLTEIADEYHVDLKDVFDVVSVNDVIQMLRQRRLSPWILLRSKKFKEFYATQTTPEERMIIETIIRIDFWSEKLSKHPEIVKTMDQFVTEMSL